MILQELIHQTAFRWKFETKTKKRDPNQTPYISGS